MTVRSAARKSFLCDVFTTALEGGIGYWALAHEYHWAAAAEGIEQDLDGFYAIVTDEEGGLLGGAQTRTDADVIARGLRRIADGEVQISPDIRAQVIHDRRLRRTGGPVRRGRVRMSALNDEVIARMSAHMDDESFARVFSPDGLARTAQWICEDEWIVEYTTTRVRHGKYDGLFIVLVFEPFGPGSKSGNAKKWRRVKVERCKTRREARARAEAHYYEHSPKRAAKHGRTS